MRKISTLLELYLKNIDETDVRQHGICYGFAILNSDGLISFDERIALRDMLLKERPTESINPQWGEPDKWDEPNYKDRAYFWRIGFAAKDSGFNKHVRIEFVEYLLEKYKELES